MKKDENDRRVVSNEELKGKIVVFYREDCSACQNVYPRLWLHQKIVDDSVFVNMNQKKNRQFIKKYRLTKVPTVIHKDIHSGKTEKRR